VILNVFEKFFLQIFIYFFFELLLFVMRMVFASFGQYPATFCFFTLSSYVTHHLIHMLFCFAVAKLEKLIIVKKAVATVNDMPCMTWFE